MLSSSTPSNRRGCDNSQVINNLSKEHTNQFTNLTKKLSNLVNDASTTTHSPLHHYIIGNNNQIIDDKLVANRVLNQTNRRRDSIESQTSLSSSTSNKFMHHVSVKVLQRRKINFDQNNECHLDSNSVEVDLIETDHQTDPSLTKTSSISSGSSGIGVSESCNRSNSKKRYFRSLHKSKKSIKTIEATLRNSRSIEQWLNDFGKIQTDLTKTDKLMNKYSFKIGSIENVSAITNLTSHRSVKRAKSFCDYDNDNLAIIDANKMFIKKKKLKKNLKSKISLDEKEEMNFMMQNQVSPQLPTKGYEQGECELKIIEKDDKEENGDDEEDDEEYDEEADSLKQLLLDIHREHDMDRYSTSSDAQFKVILQQLIESSTTNKLNKNSNILLGLANNGKRQSNTNSVNLNVIKLIDSIGHLMKTNHLNRVQNLEREMRQHISKFLLPRSLANSEDIDYLKWLLNEKNFHLTLCQPIVYTSVYTQDRSTMCDQTDYTYLLNVTNLNVKLSEQEKSDSINTTSELSSSSEDDELTESFDHADEEEKKDKNFFLKFLHNSETNEEDEELCGSLLISQKKIKKLLTKEKQLIENCRFNKMEFGIGQIRNHNFLLDEAQILDADFVQRQKRILERFRKNKLNTRNFRGAQCLLNIKSKQNLNRQTTTNLLKLTASAATAAPPQAKVSTVKTDVLTVKTDVLTVKINTGSNCSSLSSSVSPLSSSIASSISSSTSSNSMKISSTRLKKRKVQKPTTQINYNNNNNNNNNEVSQQQHQQHYFLNYSDLNERLFSCLLSNFSCKLVENFLKTSSFLKSKDAFDADSTALNENFLLKTGFIRKQKVDKSFSFINVVNEPSSIGNFDDSHDGQQEISLSNPVNPLGSDLLTTPTVQKNPTNEKNQILNLNIDTNTLKLCLKLNKWPQMYKREYFQRKRLNTKWPSKKLLNYLESSTCLITYSIPLSSVFTTDASTIEQQMIHTNDLYTNSHQWQLDTRLAESVLFKSLNQMQSFIFYFFFLTFNNLSIDTSLTVQHLTKKVQMINNNNSQAQTTKSDLKAFIQSLKTRKIYLFNFLSQRQFVQHFFRFFELNKFNLDSNNDYHKDKNKAELTSLTLSFLFDLTLKFSVYIRFVLEKYKTLNKPNYFSLNDQAKTILSSHEYQLFLNRQFSSSSQVETEFIQLVNDDLVNALVKFENVLNVSLLKKLTKNGKSDLNTNLKVFDQFLDVIHVRFGNINNLTSAIQISSPLLINDDEMKTKQENSKTLENLMNLTVEKRQSLAQNQPPVSSKYYSPLMSHYSANTYVYIYIYEFFNALFEQFKTKRDNFQINEKLLLKLHTQILEREDLIISDDPVASQILNDKFINAIKLIDKDCLLSQFEEYAECVHKYLPQIRQHNQYLLFHYVWTMQVQYLAPFFNYLCDFYPPLH
jgi:hypothetical protein